MTTTEDQFLDLSEALTGIDRIKLTSAGLVSEYIALLKEIVGDKILKRLLAAWKKAGADEEAVKKRLWDDPEFGPVARNIILMWYLGSWLPLPEEWQKEYRSDSERVPERVISTSAYKEAMVWKALGTNSRGALPQGFGSWATPPINLKT